MKGEIFMGVTADKLKDLQERETKDKAMGGPKAIEKQHQRGKLTARERINLLFDAGTFREIDMFVRHRCVDFDMANTFVPGEGVVTGHGNVNGRLVFAYSQDFTSLGGSLGEMHGRKMCKVMDLAAKMGAPLVGINDSGGARIQEGVDSLSSYGDIFFRNSNYSGVIPQIAAIMGPTAGGAVYSPAMNDWIFMTEKSSYMYITGPDVIKAVMAEEVSHEDLGGAMSHNVKSGVAHFASKSDEESIERIKDLLSYLPSSCREMPPVIDTGDDPMRVDPDLDTIIPDSPRRVHDVKNIIRSIVDNGDFIEPHEHYAKNMVICFCRFGGRTVGIIANQARVLGGSLDVNASDKATRFIRFCDAFNIPMLTIVDVPGYLPGTNQEWNGIIRHGAKLLWCYSEATVPMVTLVVRKDYGGSYLAMCSKHLGSDFVIAWPTAEIAVMGAEGACNIIHRREINEAPDPEAKRKEKIDEYNKLFSNPYIAAARGYVDEVIMPRDTRPHVIAAFEMLKDKKVERPPRKHGNIPM